MFEYKIIIMIKTKRVLHYVGAMDFGGMEALIMSIYRTVDRTEWQFDFAVHSLQKGCYEDEIERLGGRMFRFPTMRANPLEYKSQWNRFWQEHQGEFYAFQMHTNSLANIIALKSAKKSGVSVRAIYAHSSYANKGRWQKVHDVVHRWNRSHIGRYANLLFACSDLAAKWLYGDKALSHGKVIMINSGIDYQRFSFSMAQRAALRKQMGLDDKIVLCQVGHMIPVKNHCFTISLMKQLLEISDRYVCLFLGDGPFMPVLKQSVEDCQLSGKVVFLGAKSNVEDYLCASDIFLLPSLYEGMPLSVVEAQVSGLRCLISSNITKSARISDRIEYLDRTDSSAWTAAIATYTQENRIGHNLDYKFDVRTTALSYINYLSAVVLN